MLLESRLRVYPEDLQLKDYAFTLKFRFSDGKGDSHVDIASPSPEFALELVRFFEPLRKQAPEYLKHHAGTFSIAVPQPGSGSVSARIHIIVPFIDDQDIDTVAGIDHREDFDRLMDLLQIAIGEMVENGLLRSGVHSVDIVAEPLAADGKLKQHKVDFLSFAIGATWLNHKGKEVFSDYRYWKSAKGRWVGSKEE